MGPPPLNKLGKNSNVAVACWSLPECGLCGDPVYVVGVVQYVYWWFMLYVVVYMKLAVVHRRRCTKSCQYAWGKAQG